MSSRSIDFDLRERAAGWAVRLDAGDCPEEELKQLDAWLAADPAHRAALNAARALWLELDVPALESVHRIPPRLVQRRSLGWIAVAATVLMSVGIASVTRDEWLMQIRADERTAVGESRWVTLEDGSRIQLNTQTAIAVDYSRSQRTITLLEGEAAFEVAHDPARPFRVIAADGAVTALGTVFQVRIDAGPATHVVVAEGRVRVRSGANEESVAAGEQIVYSNQRLRERAPVDIESASAWRRGQLSFIEQPLGVVVAQLDRYYAGRIQVADPALATRPVSGVFATARPLDAVAVIGRNLGLKTRRDGDTIILD